MLEPKHQDFHISLVVVVVIVVVVVVVVVVVKSALFLPFRNSLYQWPAGSGSGQS